MKYKTLLEATRTELINQSRNAGQYSDGSGNRWTAKNDCKIANTVADYNNIDMDTFFKKDILKFGIRVEGKTDTYVVTILFKDILKEIQDQVKRNKNRLDAKIIYDALMRAITHSDILVGCTCPDYNYRFRYWGTKNGYNAGDQENREAKLTNPDNNKGAACKHILAVLNNAEWLKKVASVINNYINYCKDHMEYNYSRFIFPKIYNMTYDKAVQLTFDDYDEKGETKDNLQTDEAIINLSNALGKVRGRFKKGENKNPINNKKQESFHENLDINEALSNPTALQSHFDRHCAASGRCIDAYPFSEKQISSKEQYLDLATWFVNQSAGRMPFPSVKYNMAFTDDIIEYREESSNNSAYIDFVRYCPIKEKAPNPHGKLEQLYLFAVWYEDEEGKKQIRSCYKVDIHTINNKAFKRNNLNVLHIDRLRRKN